MLVSVQLWAIAKAFRTHLSVCVLCLSASVCVFVHQNISGIKAVSNSTPSRYTHSALEMCSENVIPSYITHTEWLECSITLEAQGLCVCVFFLVCVCVWYVLIKTCPALFYTQSALCLYQLSLSLSLCWFSGWCVEVCCPVRILGSK